MIFLKAIQILLKVVTLFNTQLGFRLTRFLASMPRRSATKERDQDFINSAKIIEFYRGGAKKVALSWGKGPVVLLMHGWESRSTHMAAMAQQLADQGFQAIALDFTAHGLSQGRTSGFEAMYKDIHALQNYVVENISPNIHAMVGHSGGGFCMMGNRLLNPLNIKSFVVIASPLVPHPAIDGIANALKASKSVMSLVKENIADTFNTNWASFKNGYIYKPCSQQEQLLLIFDEEDNVVNHQDAEIIQGHFEQSTIYKTQGLGHTRLLWDQGVIDQVCDFISATNHQFDKPKTRITAKL